MSRILCSFLIILSLSMVLSACVSSPKAELPQFAPEDYFAGYQLELIRAVDDGMYDVALVEIQRGADVNAIGRDNMTPLLWSFQRKDTRGVELLLKLGADVNESIRTPSSFLKPSLTLLELAVIENDTRYLELMLAHGGDPNLIVHDTREQPIIFSAIRANNLKAVKLLHKAGADLNHADSRGQTPIRIAVSMGNYTIAAYLLGEGADPTVETIWGSTISDLLEQLGPIHGLELNEYFRLISELHDMGLISNKLFLTSDMQRQLQNQE